MWGLIRISKVSWASGSTFPCISSACHLLRGLHFFHLSRRALARCRSKTVLPISDLAPACVSKLIKQNETATLPTRKKST